MSSRRPTRRPPSHDSAPSDEREARLAVDLPRSLHRALKRRAAERGISIRQLMLELLARSGIG